MKKSLVKRTLKYGKGWFWLLHDYTLSEVNRSKIKSVSNVEKMIAGIIKGHYNKQKNRSSIFPNSVAAGAIYIASVIYKLPITQRRIAEYALVTEVTVRHAYKTLLKELGESYLLNLYKQIHKDKPKNE